MSETVRRLVLLGPGLGWLAIFLVAPCAIVFVYSFFERGTYGGIDYVFTLENYARAVDPLYLSILLTSARVAVITTLAALVIGYPAAYLIATAPKSWQMPLLILVMLPFWSNYLIRTYAWIVLLNNQGLINHGLQELGIISAPLPMLYNEFAIVVGLLYGYLPFMVLALYSSISRLNREIFEASADLGASSLRTFARVTVPLTIPGIAAGCGLRVRAQHRQLRDAQPAGRRPLADGRQPDLRPVPVGARLAVRGRARLRADRPDDAVAGRAGLGASTGRSGTAPMRRTPIERRLLRGHLGLVYLFLYGPIVVLIALSFNESGLPTAWTGFSVEWYGKMLANRGDPPGRHQHADRRGLSRPSSQP